MLMARLLVVHRFQKAMAGPIRARLRCNMTADTSSSTEKSPNSGHSGMISSPRAGGAGLLLRPTLAPDPRRLLADARSPPGLCIASPAGAAVAGNVGTSPAAKQCQQAAKQHRPEPGRVGDRRQGVVPSCWRLGHGAATERRENEGITRIITPPVHFVGKWIGAEQASQSIARNSSGLFAAGEQRAAVQRRVAQLFFDPQQLVVLGHPIGAAERSRS